MSAATSRAWIDFRALRKQLDFRQVLKHYGVEVKENGKVQTMCFCPLPTHQGKKRSPSFSVNVKKGIWQCFGCSAKGNVLDFAARMEGLDPMQGGEIRKAALKLIDVFQLSVDERDRVNPPQERRIACSTETTSSVPLSDLPVVVNPPLDFELKTIDVDHRYLRKRGFLPDTIKHFGLGFCNRGMLKDRIAIPIKDVRGQLGSV